MSIYSIKYIVECRLFYIESEQFFHVEYFVTTLQGFCPALDHGQKFGILYVHSTDDYRDYETTQQKESTTVQSHSVMVIPSQSSEGLLPDYSSDHIHNDSQTHESDDTSSKWDFCC